jgi:hypothetical protein
MSAAQPTGITDDDQVRVPTWTFGADDATTGPHCHDFDYVVVPVTGGTFMVTETDGSPCEMTQEAGSPYLGPGTA